MLASYSRDLSDASALERPGTQSFMGEICLLGTISQKYPRLCAGGRPVDAQQDSPSQTSFETYLTGELMTYSKQTLRLYLKHVHQLLRHQKNMNLISLEAIAKEYGYTMPKPG